MTTNTLIGIETEYALTVLDNNGCCTDSSTPALSLLAIANKRFQSLEGYNSKGIFFANGGRFYIDVGNHPEYCTPECTNPWDLVRYVLAGDLIMAELVREYEQNHTPSRALVFRGNTGYGPQPEAWACHENYLCRFPPTRYKNIIPFLVSRIVYTGSGGFDPFSPGISFTLSPRSHFLTTVTSDSTMDSRSILNLRDQPLGGNGYHRLHLICADALGSEVGMFLQAGVTALVIAMIDAGGLPDEQLMLKNPMAALRVFSADPTLTATAITTEGNQVSAIDIQRYYLALVCRQHSCGGLPEWSEQVLKGWEMTLDMLQNTHALQGTDREWVLDWTIKRAVYTAMCDAEGFEWESLKHWNNVAAKLFQEMKRNTPAIELLTPEMVKNLSPERSEAKEVIGYLNNNGMMWSDLPRFLKLRLQLLEADTRFLELGGIFYKMNEAGILNHNILTDRSAIDLAVSSPPETGRAALRGAFVKQNAHSEHHQCTWEMLANLRTRQVAPLNPFQNNIVWKDEGMDGTSSNSIMNNRSIALTCYNNGEYAAAIHYLQEMIDADCELPSTHCHLARIAIITGDLDEAAEHTNAAWELRDEAQTYIVARTLWLKIAISMLQSCSYRTLLGKLKTVIQQDDFDAEWSMSPVLDYLENKIRHPEHALLAALVEVLSGSRLPDSLEVFHLWNILPQPLD